MADSVFRTVARGNTTVGYGGYGFVDVTYTLQIRITIYENPVGNNIGLLETWINNANDVTAVQRADSLTGTGGGFYNATGFMWGGASYTRQEHYLYPVGDDSLQRAEQELDWFTSDYFVKFWFPDDVIPMPLYKSIKIDRWSRYLTASDLDENGNLKPIVIARVFSRWYYWKETFDPDDPNRSVVDVVRDVTSEELVIDWDYYPWSVRINGTYMSCNRDYDTPSASRTAYLRRKASSWNDVLNNLNDPSKGESWRKIGGRWRMLNINGNNG